MDYLQGQLAPSSFGDANSDTSEDMEMPYHEYLHNNFFVIHTITIRADEVAFCFHDDNELITSAARALHFIKLCKAANEFTLVSELHNDQQLHEITYVHTLFHNVDNHFYDDCISITINGRFSAGVLHRIAGDLSPITQSIDMRRFSTNWAFTIAHLVRPRLSHLSELTFDCRYTNDSDFESNVYSLVNSRIYLISHVSLIVTGFPALKLKTVINLLCAVTTFNSNVVVLTSSPCTQYFADILTEEGFVAQDQAEFFLDIESQLLDTFSMFNLHTDRSITFGFLVPRAN